MLDYLLIAALAVLALGNPMARALHARRMGQFRRMFSRNHE
ncbi:hypothetical protein [Roseovarius spongiae]|nr:hypothetical protein [Roseovarius spongiae]